MKRGLDWYKREPQSFLDGVRAARMTARQVAVFGVILDLIYAGGGQTPNDPKFISAHFADLGTAVVRREIEALAAIGKLATEGEFLTNNRAKKQAKTKEKLRETRAEIGRFGGVCSGNSRRESNEINMVTEPIGSTAGEAEKRREEKKKKETPNGVSKKGTRLSAGWFLPREWGEWAASEGWAESAIREEADKFRDHWISVSGQRGVKRDWLATWRNWMRNTKTPKAAKGGSNAPRQTDRLQRIVTAAAVGTSADDWPAGGGDPEPVLAGGRSGRGEGAGSGELDGPPAKPVPSRDQTGVAILPVGQGEPHCNGGAASPRSGQAGADRAGEAPEAGACFGQIAGAYR